MHQTMKDKKELENLKEQIKIKEEYMKTVDFLEFLLIFFI